MKVYSIQIPSLASATFHKQDGVWRHTQDPKHFKRWSKFIWNSITKTTEKTDYEMTETVTCPLVMCYPKDVNDFVDHNLILLEKHCMNDLSEGNLFVCHSDLHFTPTSIPIYIGVFKANGVGETLWEKS